MKAITNVFELVKYSILHFFREVKEIATERTMYTEVNKK
jgi:hypothetical protein